MEHLMPVFRRNADGQLLISDTPSAMYEKKAGKKKNYEPPKKAEQVKKEAMEELKKAGGDVNDKAALLGKFRVQFGAYRGMPFLWVLENAPGYAAWMAIEGEKEAPSTQPNWLNKMAMKNYMDQFEESRQIMEIKKKEHAEKAQSRVQPPAPDLTDYELLQAAEAIELSHFSGKVKPTQTMGRQSEQPPVKSTKETVVSSGHTMLQHINTQSSSVGQSSSPVQSGDSLATSKGTVQLDITEELHDAQSELPTSQTSELPTSQTLQQSSATPDVLLYQNWRQTLPTVDHKWVSAAFFRLNPNNNIEFKTEKGYQLWHHPPQPSISTNNMNSVDGYFAHRMFLWLPLTVWGVCLRCPHTDLDSNISCGGEFTKSGMYQKTRLVLDIQSFYVLATEYLKCTRCGRKLPAWAHSIISQLDLDRQLLFPCILTSKYACDKRVVGFLRHRGLGNSSSMVRRQLEELHGNYYEQQVHHYLSNQMIFKQSQVGRFVSSTSPKEPPPMTPVPQHRWLMTVYQLDVLQRLDYIKASITSLFGNILKLDSTKKITKKLAGRSAKTAMWATNVGNEHGQVIMSVLTTNEGQGLSNMITGLCRRYKLAAAPAPQLLYVDRDCCGNGFIGKYFDWPYLNVRLDIWHFMRRFTSGCTTDAHPLYGVFMAGLSKCIFQWDEDDLNLLKKAKQAELLQQHITNPSEADVIRHIKKDELSLHCRRITRGTIKTTALISQLIQSLEGEKALDILGVPLFEGNKVQDIWAKQSHHVTCIQDPQGVMLYTQVKTLRKGGVELPVYRCARGSTSLESFHLHMNRFIPGTLAGDVNFQVYLLDGLNRWNQDRARDAVETQRHTEPLSYDGILRHSVNKLSQDLLKRDFCQDFSAPRKYTGELIGLEYLYSQSSQGGTEQRVRYAEATTALEDDSRVDVVEDEDEGFGEPESVADLTIPDIETLPATPAKSTSTESVEGLLSGQTEPDHVDLQPPADTRADAEPVQLPRHSPDRDQQANIPLELGEGGETAHDDSDIGPDNIAGYSAVIKLASCLAKLHEQETGLSSEQADEIILLWSGLSQFDKERTKFPDRFTKSPTGRFRSKKKNVAPGVVSIERAILGPNSTRANWPNCNRYVEATVEQLLATYPSDRRVKTQSGTIKSTTRWTLIREGYSNIQKLVIKNRRVMDRTEIQLPSLNNKTIQQWYNQKGKEEDLKILLQGIEKVQAPMAGSGAPAPKRKPDTIRMGSMGEPFKFNLPPDTAGMAKLKMRRKKSATSDHQAVRSILPKSPPAPALFLLQQPGSTQQTAIATEMTTAIVTTPTVMATQSTPEFMATLTTQTQSLASPSVLHTGVKRKLQDPAVPKKQATCRKCGQPRVQPLHKQYMGYWWCARDNQQPFDEWRAELVSRGVARKRNRLPDQ